MAKIQQNKNMKCKQNKTIKFVCVCGVCFCRSVLKSFSYVFWDFMVIGLLFYFATYIDKIPLLTVRWLAWCVYWYFQGAFMTGVWVIAHECGHQAFSANAWINDITGLFLHTMLNVPYFSWKYSHAQHHSNTDSLDKDTVFIPPTFGLLAFFFYSFFLFLGNFPRTLFLLCIYVILLG